MRKCSSSLLIRCCVQHASTVHRRYHQCNIAEWQTPLCRFEILAAAPGWAALRVSVTDVCRHHTARATTCQRQPAAGLGVLTTPARRRGGRRCTRTTRRAHADERLLQADQQPPHAAGQLQVRRSQHFWLDKTQPHCSSSWAPTRRWWCLLQADHQPPAVCGGS